MLPPIRTAATQSADACAIGSVERIAGGRTEGNSAGCPVQIREHEDLVADAGRWRALPRNERDERQSAMRQNSATLLGLLASSFAVLDRLACRFVCC